jgi:signal transduction histidine kinase
VLSLESIFDILTRELGKLVSHDAMWIALFDGTDSELAIRHINPSGLISLFDRGRIPLGGSIHGLVIDRRETMHAEIGHSDLPGFFETRIFHAEGFQSYLIAPLPARNRIIGTLTIASTAPDAFSSSLTPIMTSLAGAVAVAIEQTDLFQRISRFANELEHKVDDRTRELERANKKLIQTEKYFATGRMAGNLAHEINNPLGIIKNYLHLVEHGLKAGAEAGGPAEVSREHLRIIHEEVDRIARMIRQMINLHRPEEQAVRPIDVNGLIEEILALMEQELEKQGIRVARELDPALPTPLGSPDLIRQVLINLIRNAQDAMETEGGTLTVRTSVETQWSDGAEHELLRIRVADTGRGIPPEHLSQIFDPFFTTKPPDKGTGLGLCVSYSIVSMYRGTIDVESQVGTGTAVVVTLPVEGGEAEQPTMPQIMEERAPVGD